MTDNPIQNFGLRCNEFNELVVFLQKGDETLFEKIFVKHFSDCRSYLMRECNASSDDAYDMTVDTIIAFRKRLVEGKIEYGNLRFYFTKMAKDSYLKLLQKAKRMPTDEYDLSNFDPEEDAAEGFDEDQLQSLDRAWTKLGEECKKLLKSHVYDGLQLKQVAQILSENEANIRKRKERCMEKLKSAFFETHVF